MKVLAVCLVLLSAVLAVSSLGLHPKYAVFEVDSRVVLEGDIKPPTAPASWKMVGSARPKSVRVIVAVKQQNKDVLKDRVDQVSDPQHPKYGQHMTNDELTDLIAPEQASIDLVTKWLKAYDAEDIKISGNGGDFIHANVPVPRAEHMFGCQFRAYRNNKSGKVLIKTEQLYSVPASIATVVDYVAGPMFFPSENVGPISVTSLADANPGYDPLITPDMLRERYNVTTQGNGAKTNNSMAVAEFQGQYFEPSDLVQFFKQFVSNSTADTVAQTVGPNTPTEPGIEAELDIQYIMGVAPNIPTWFWSNSGDDFWTDLTAWTSQISSTKDAPIVHSVSYGDQAAGISHTTQDRLNTEFQKLGVRGISIIFASGDSGTGCDLCFHYEPSFPATSPYVTSVGATHFLNGAVGPEGAVTGFSSGGGFSWYFDQPSYQSAAVASYITNAPSLPDPILWNKKGRGTPDVSALGWNFQVVVGGGVAVVGGTSAAAPTFSAIIGLLNEQRLQSGGAPLWFLNPRGYQNGSSPPSPFYYVNQGANPPRCRGSGF
eukprot:TRINITY_DN601_c0_g1_i3.p1 TRINITY_DN601_c0_g1~~TRINITY_DN601_c0_g1_i3.p1  ORF type:complete len:561 (-),score=132.99 TRINITY_DN601_c0_g1_i3:81-1712(-)